MPSDKELRVKLTAEADTDKVEEFAEAIDEVPEKVKSKLDVDPGDSEQVVRDVAETLEKIDSTEATADVKVVVDDAALAAARRAKTSIDDIGKSADSSKSVLANMVGNATQDLGALSGVAGSAGVAIGQMAEYMADATAAGEGIGSVAGNFAKVIGPVAAISLGVGLLTTVLGNMGKSAEEARKRAEEFGKAVEATGGNVTAAFAKLAEAGNFDDLIDDLDRLGLSYEQFVDLASGGAIALDPVRADAIGRIRSLEKLFKTTGAQTYRKQIGDIADEMGLTTQEALDLAKSFGEVTDRADESADAIQRSLDAYAQQRRVMADNARVIDTVNEAVKLGLDVTGKSTTQLEGEIRALERGNEARLLNRQHVLDGIAAREEATAAANDTAAAYEREAAAVERLNAGYDARRGAVLSQAEQRVALAEAQERYNESLADEEATVDQRVVNAQQGR